MEIKKAKRVIELVMEVQALEQEEEKHHRFAMHIRGQRREMLKAAQELLNGREEQRRLF